MEATAIPQVLLFFGLVILSAPLMGRWLAVVMDANGKHLAGLAPRSPWSACCWANNPGRNKQPPLTPFQCWRSA